MTKIAFFLFQLANFQKKDFFLFSTQILLFPWDWWADPRQSGSCGGRRRWRSRGGPGPGSGPTGGPPGQPPQCHSWNKRQCGYKIGEFYHIMIIDHVWLSPDRIWPFHDQIWLNYGQMWLNNWLNVEILWQNVDKLWLVAKKNGYIPNHIKLPYD